MRRVLKDTREVFHYWANQSQSEGECGNVSFRDSMAFSYARCIAKIHTKGDRKLVLFGTTGRNSPTTAKHQHYARMAVTHLDQVAVPHHDPHGPDHAVNLTALAQDVADWRMKAKRSRMYKDSYFEYAANAAEKYNLYAEFFDRPERFNEEALAELVAAREQAEAELKVQRAQAAKMRDLQLQADLIEWRAGMAPRGSLNGLSFIALRLSKGEMEVQTSRGARIPVSDAVKLWKLIERVRRGEEDFLFKGTRLGGYSLDAIRKDGSIVVGCHDIPYAEIEGIARQLGLLEVTA